MRIDRVKFAAALAREDLTCLQLAELAGVSRVTVTSVKGGKSCSPETARKLAGILGAEIILDRREATLHEQSRSESTPGENLPKNP